MKNHQLFGRFKNQNLKRPRTIFIQLQINNPVALNSALKGTLLCKQGKMRRHWVQFIHSSARTHIQNKNQYVI